MFTTMECLNNENTSNGNEAAEMPAAARESIDDALSDKREAEHYAAQEKGEKILENAGDRKESGEKYAKAAMEQKTGDGAAAIIYHENPKTGDVEFYLEEKPHDYAIKKERGKLSLIGGAINADDRGSLEALVREISEEVEDNKAKEILIEELLESRDLYKVVREDVGGKASCTYVYLINIKSPKKWETVVQSSLTGDAGISKALKLEEAVSKNSREFAFKYGNVLKGFIPEYFPVKYWEAAHSSNYRTLPQAYYSLPQAHRIPAYGFDMPNQVRLDYRGTYFRSPAIPAAVNNFVFN